jgi:hypothetical protein
VICPHCNGKGEQPAFVTGERNGERFCEHRLMPCRTCSASGEITEEHAQRIEAGQRMREDRVARGVSMCEEAKRLGVSDRELGDLEWGRG